MSDAEPTVSFELALAELEKVIGELEDGAIPLEDALCRYERGIGLLKSCYQKLRQAELRIQELTGVDENGQPQLRPFGHDPSPAADHSEARRRRKNPDSP